MTRQDCQVLAKFMQCQSNPLYVVLRDSPNGKINLESKLGNLLLTIGFVDACTNKVLGIKIYCLFSVKQGVLDNFKRN